MLKMLNVQKLQVSWLEAILQIMGLKDLIKEFIGTDISKQLQNSIWRKLSEKQLNYCANDVIYLHKIYDD